MAPLGIYAVLPPWDVVDLIRGLLRVDIWEEEHWRKGLSIPNLDL